MAIVFRIAAGLLGWFALALQYGLMMAGNFDTNATMRTINFFSYFTILTNILAALVLTLPVIAPQSALGAVFRAAHSQNGNHGLHHHRHDDRLFCPAPSHQPDGLGFSCRCDAALCDAGAVRDRLAVFRSQGIAETEGRDLVTRLSGCLSHLDLNPRRLFRLLPLSLPEFG